MRIRVFFLTVFGLIFLLLGFIGIFLPVLPTTPFFLLAVACFSNTPKLQARVMQIPVFRTYIENYRSRAGLPRKTVVKSLVFLWGMLSLSMYLIGALWAVVLLTIVGTCVTIHILHIAKPRPAENE